MEDRIIIIKFSKTISKTLTNGSKIPFTPKGGRFCENYFLKLLIGSQPIIKGMFFICERWSHQSISLDNARNFRPKICQVWG